MVTRRAKALLREIFFFLLSVDIGCAPLLLRLFSFAAVGVHRTGGILASCAKELAPVRGAGFFALPGPQQGRTARIFGNKVLLSTVFLDKVSGFRKDSFGKFVLRNACVCAGLCYNRCKHF